MFKKVIVIKEGGQYYLFQFKLIPYLQLFFEKPYICAVELFHIKDTYWLFDFVLWNMKWPYWRYAIRKTRIYKGYIQTPT